MSSTMLDLFITAFGETLFMVGASGLNGTILGCVLGSLLYTARQQRSSAPALTYLIRLGTAAVQSTPSIILLTALIPLAHFLWGGATGLASTILPLTIIATSFMARHVDAALCAVDHQIIDATRTMGASRWQTIYHVLLPEAAPSIVSGLGIMLASLVGYSALAGALGGGGLGNLGIHYGYGEFLPEVMLPVVLILVALAETFHVVGAALAHRLNQR